MTKVKIYKIDFPGRFLFENITMMLDFFDILYETSPSNIPQDVITFLKDSNIIIWDNFHQSFSPAKYFNNISKIVIKDGKRDIIIMINDSHKNLYYIIISDNPDIMKVKNKDIAKILRAADKIVSVFNKIFH